MQYVFSTLFTHRETFYPVNTYFYITRGLQETVQLCGHSTLENC